MPGAVHISVCVVLLLAIQSVAPQEGVTIHITGSTRIIIGSPGAPTAEQCNGEDGFCVETGDRCNGTFKILHNCCNDHCSCCVPDKQECLSPWVHLGSSGCFLFVQQRKDWDSARSHCQELDGDLAVLDVASKRIDTANYLHANRGTLSRSYWVGSTSRSGSWQWINGQKVTEGWYKGGDLGPAQPDGYEGDNIGCMIMSDLLGRNDTLGDTRCRKTITYPILCEK